MSTYTGPAPAGWYPGPEHDGRLRYWDGQRWTEHYAPGVPMAPAPFPGGPPAPRPPQSPSGTTIAVIVGLVALGVAGLLVAVAVLSGGSGGGGNGGGSDDSRARAGAEAIAQAAEDFAGTYGYGPGVDDARPDGALAEFTDPWPTNPFTDEPMMPGSGSGDYTFHTATSMGVGEEYLGYVDVVLSSGEIYSAPFEY